MSARAQSDFSAPARHRGHSLIRDPESVASELADQIALCSAPVAVGPEETVGRSSELGRLQAILAELGEGRAGSLAIAGEPGIGKTRLLSDLRELADGCGYLVLDGAASEYERDVPFAVWTDALDSYLAARNPQRFDDWDPELLEDLAWVLPSLAADGARAAPPDERYRIHRAVRAILGLIAQTTPLVLLLDDLHWADQASIDLIAALLRREASAPVLLALAFRSGMAPETLSSALTAPQLTLIELRPLDRGDCAALIGEVQESRRMEQIYLEGGGNPFYSLQLGQSQAPLRNASSDQVAGQTGVPPLVAASLLEELGVLSPDARLLLKAAAIMGDPFEPELAYEVAEIDDVTGVQVLDELLDAKLLHPTSVPRRFAFRHPLVRRAVHESAQAGWRLSAHGRAAAAMEARGASVLARARHVEFSAVSGDLSSVELLITAAAASRPRSPAAAARWYGAALRLLPSGSEDRRLEVLTDLAMAQGANGDLLAARESYLSAIDLVSEGDPASKLRLIAACAASEHFLGRHEEGQARLSRALAALPVADSRARAEAMIALATGAFFQMEPAPMCEYARRAVEEARKLDDNGLLFAALCTCAHVVSLSPELGEARQLVAEAAVLHEHWNDEDLASRLGSVNRLAWAALILERYDEAIAYASKGIRVGRGTGQNQFLPNMLAAQALAEMFTGLLPAASERVIDALEIARLAANPYIVCTVLTAGSQIASAIGDREQARLYIEEAVGLVELRPGRRLPAVAAVRLAVLRREAGESAAASRDLVDLAGGWDLPLFTWWRPFYLDILTRVALAEGELHQAEHFAEQTDTAVGDGLSLEEAFALRARAAVTLASGDARGAAEMAADSADAAERAGARVEAARSRALAGRALVSAGDRDRGVATLREAESGLREAGALRSRDEARRELRRLGARVEPRGLAAVGETGLESLSAREREVADLVRNRLTNKQIAADLFLSEKTVESHLRNIFFKLNVSSRVEVAREVERKPSDR